MKVRFGSPLAVPEGAVGKGAQRCSCQRELRYRITLPDEERDQLRSCVRAGKGESLRLKRTQILLASETGAADATSAQNISVRTSAVFRTKRRFVEEGLDATLRGPPRPGADWKLAEEEALLIATAYSAPPAGQARWALEILAGETMRMTKNVSLSSETIRRWLAQNEPHGWTASATDEFHLAIS